MKESRYPFPECLDGCCNAVQFEKWLERKACSLRKRDKKRGNTTATRETYKVAIHQAVIRSAGKDEYTGRPLDWTLISRYDNGESKRHGRRYKKKFGDLPTVDHIDDGLGAPSFAICSWRVNDAKNDLTLSEFIELCHEVIDFSDKKLPTIASS